jgi:hypothetical protein
VRLKGPGTFGRLSGAQINAFKKALLDAFPTVPALDQMLRVYLDRQRQPIALGDNLDEIVFKVIETAETESWTAELLAGARSANPPNDALLLFAQPFGLAPASPGGIQLQNTIREANSTLDPVPWRARMAEIEGQVCRVEVYLGQPPQYGTGFLVGPSLVMTNYHVVEPVIKKEIKPEKVALRFDYKALSDGLTVRAGTAYELAYDLPDDQWLVAASPYSAVDETGGPGDPETWELDYALLRVKGTPGKDPVGGPDIQLEQPRPRGWIEIPAGEHDFEKYRSIFIVQHPEDGPLKFALDTNSVLGLNGKRTRVRYATTTRPGSSGSPCFDGNWNLVALHHSGDPKFPKLRRAEYNQGIPLAAILTLLGEKKGLLGQL